MRKYAALHMRMAVCYALIAMVLGIYMGAGQNFSLATAHAHLNLVGWVSTFLYGLVLMVFRDREASALVRWHFWLAHTGVVLMVAGLAYMILTGASDAVAIIGALFTVAAMALFAGIVFRLTAAE